MSEDPILQASIFPSLANQPTADATRLVLLLPHEYLAQGSSNEVEPELASARGSRLSSVSTRYRYFCLVRMSKSFTNLFDLSGETTMLSKPFARTSALPRAATALSLYGEEESTNSVMSDPPSSVSHDRIILVANMLPLHAERNVEKTGWLFTWNEDTLLKQMKSGLQLKDNEDMEVLYVGSLSVDVDPSEQDEVAAHLLEKFSCVPTFLSPDLKAKFYLGFCKQQLWPIFHYQLPLTPEHDGRFNRTLWQAYVSANKIFADKVMEIISPEDDYVWVHDYHLMVLPTFLRKRFNRVRLGFFLHSPFPSSEIYRTLTVRDELLRALLNSDLVGFHTFDYARHFLSCCSRMLGLEYESKRGYIGLDYYGRTVGIKIMPVGVDVGQLNGVLNSADAEWRVGELRAQFEGKTLLLGVDDMDIFKGIGLKLLAMESMLRQHPEWVGRAVLVQIANPARGKGKEVAEVQEEAYTIAKRINKEFGREGYEPVVLLERHVPLYERVAFYTLAEACVVTAVRDGMNLIPYEYIVCREGGGGGAGSGGGDTPPMSVGVGVHRSTVGSESKKSMLVVSEFIGCSPSLSGAIRVNPWNTEAVAEAMNAAITMPHTEQRMRHEKHYRYVATHTVTYWAQSYMSDLERTCKERAGLTCNGIGFGLGFRTVAMDPKFSKLQTGHIAQAYRRTQGESAEGGQVVPTRLLLLDYDGTMMPQTSIDKTPSPQVKAVLNSLCSDPHNVVFIVSGRAKDVLSDWFQDCPLLGLAAEHGYAYRMSASSQWLHSIAQVDTAWMEAALPVLELYTESTDGSYIERKESALVWHHQEADPDFGSWQAKELVNHLESVLANDPVVVKSGHQIAEIKPQGVSKGAVVELVMAKFAEVDKKLPAFVLCIGDDRSDEDMFERITALVSEDEEEQKRVGSEERKREAEEEGKEEGGGEKKESERASPQHHVELFACTVGQKPSKAKYYLDDTMEVMKMLQGLASVRGDVAAEKVDKERRAQYSLSGDSGLLSDDGADLDPLL